MHLVIISNEKERSDCQDRKPRSTQQNSSRAQPKINKRKRQSDQGCWIIDVERNRNENYTMRIIQFGTKENNWTWIIEGVNLS